MPPIPSSAKDSAILSTARTLFLQHGIRRVSIEEICREARVSKRTFYTRYRDKDALAVRVLGELIEESRRPLEVIIAGDLPIEDKLREIITTKSGQAGETSLEFYQEVMTADSEPGRFVRQKQREWEERVRGFYVEAQARGQIRSDLDLDLLMFLLTRIRDLMGDPEFQRIQPDFGRMVESVMKLFFYGIVPRPERPRRGARRAKRRKP